MKALIITLGALCVLSSTAHAQATRTWVSGVGDDANPCSRTAPCLTVAGALGKTAAGGEIDALDGGNFGSVTIAKSITIDFSPRNGMLTSVTINAAATDTVVLRRVQFNGDGIDANGLRIQNAKTVQLEHCDLSRYTNAGIVAENVEQLLGNNVKVRNVGNAGLLIQSATAATFTKSSFEGSSFGVYLTGDARLTLFDSEVSHSGTAGVSAAAGQVNLERVLLSTNHYGVETTGTGLVRMSNVTGLSNSAVSHQAGTARVLSFGNNRIPADPASCVTALPADLPPATLGAAYSFDFDNRFNVSVDGTLPPGLTLSGRTISGTPTELGTFSFTLRAQADGSCAAERDTIIKVNKAANIAVSVVDGVVTVTVTSDGPVSGSVTIFVDGAPVGTVTLDANGVGTFSLGMLPPGPHTVTATYSGDDTHSETSGERATEGADFTLAAEVSSDGSVSVAITSINGFAGDVVLDCAEAPEGAQCVFDASTVTLMTGGTSATRTTLQKISAAFMGVLALFGMQLNKRRRLLVALFSIVCMVACAAGTTTISGPITVRATSGNIVHTITVER